MSESFVENANWWCQVFAALFGVLTAGVAVIGWYMSQHESKFKDAKLEAYKVQVAKAGESAAKANQTAELARKETAHANLEVAEATKAAAKANEIAEIARRETASANLEIARANESAAKASENADMARKETAIANREMENIRRANTELKAQFAWREILPAQKQAFLLDAKEAPAGTIAVYTDPNDPEAFAYGQELLGMFMEAKLPVQPNLLGMQRFSTAGPTMGLEIEVRDPRNLPPIANYLIQQLTRVGIGGSIGNYAGAVPTNEVWLVVGQKPRRRM